MDFCLVTMEWRNHVRNQNRFFCAFLCCFFFFIHLPVIFFYLPQSRLKKNVHLMHGHFCATIFVDQIELRQVQNPTCQAVFFPLLCFGCRLTQRQIRLLFSIRQKSFTLQKCTNCIINYLMYINAQIWSKHSVVWRRILAIARALTHRKCLCTNKIRMKTNKILPNLIIRKMWLKEKLTL